MKNFNPETPCLGLDIMNHDHVEFFFNLETTYMPRHGYARNVTATVQRSHACNSIKEFGFVGRCHPDVTFLAINHYDSFISYRDVPVIIQDDRVANFRLFITACFTLAKKTKDPTYNTADFPIEQKSDFDTDDLTNMEHIIELCLEIRGCRRPISSLAFLDFFVSALLVDTDESQLALIKEFATHRAYAQQYDIKYTGYRPSIQAAAAILYSCGTFYRDKYLIYEYSIFESHYIDNMSLEGAIQIHMPPPFRLIRDNEPNRDMPNRDMPSSPPRPSVSHDATNSSTDGVPRRKGKEPMETYEYIPNKVEYCSTWPDQFRPGTSAEYEFLDYRPTLPPRPPVPRYQETVVFNLEIPCVGLDIMNPNHVDSFFELETTHMPPYGYAHNIGAADQRAYACNVIKEFGGKYNPAVPFLAISYYDNFVSTTEVPKVVYDPVANFKLFLTCCFTLAMRMNYLDYDPINFQTSQEFDFVAHELYAMEDGINQCLESRCCKHPITSLAFLDLFISLMDVDDTRAACIKNFATHRAYAQQYDIEYNEYRPSILAATAILYSCLKFYPDENDMCEDRIFQYHHLDPISLSQALELDKPPVVARFQPETMKSVWDSIIKSSIAPSTSAGPPRPASPPLSQDKDPVHDTPSSLTRLSLGRGNEAMQVDTPPPNVVQIKPMALKRVRRLVGHLSKKFNLHTTLASAGLGPLKILPPTPPRVTRPRSKAIYRTAGPGPGPLKILPPTPPWVTRPRSKAIYRTAGPGPGPLKILSPTPPRVTQSNAVNRTASPEAAAAEDADHPDDADRPDDSDRPPKKRRLDF